MVIKLRFLDTLHFTSEQHFLPQTLAHSAPKTKGRLRAGDRLPDEIEGDSHIYAQLKHAGATLLIVGIDEEKLPKTLGRGANTLPLKVVNISADGSLAEQLDLKHGGIAMIRPDSYIGAIVGHADCQ